MIFEAGLLAFIRTILIVVGIYYAFKVVIRFFIPFLIRRFLSRQFSSYGNQEDTSFSNKKMNTSSSKKSKEREKLGEYVDYEEITEK